MKHLPLSPCLIPPEFRNAMCVLIFMAISLLHRFSKSLSSLLTVHIGNCGYAIKALPAMSYLKMILIESYITRQV